MAVAQTMTPNDSAGGEEEAPLPKLGGVFWWLILGLLILIDILGAVFSLALEAVGTGLSATVVGSVIGVPLAILGWVIGIFLTGNALIITFGYFMFNHVSLMQSRKLAAWGVNAIIEAVPLLSVFPTSSLTFVVVTLMENAKRGASGSALGKAVGTVAKKAVSKTPVGYTAVKVAEKVL